MLTLEKFEEAAEAVKKVTLETKLVYSEYFSEQTGNKVYFKPENMQYTGAYKVRGAYYKISTLTEEERAKGLITASAGNHAQGVAYAAKKYGVKAVVVMPTTTPLMKVNRTKSYGAEVVLYGDVYDEACEYAYKLAEENGETYEKPEKTGLFGMGMTQGAAPQQPSVASRAAVYCNPADDEDDEEEDGTDEDRTDEEADPEQTDEREDGADQKNPDEEAEK